MRGPIISNSDESDASDFSDYVSHSESEFESDFESDGSASDEGLPPNALITMRLERCRVCNKNIGALYGAPEKCTLCGFVQHLACNSAGRRIMSLSDHNVTGIPSNSFHSNTYEQVVIGDYIVSKGLMMSDLYGKLLNDMESKNWTINDGMIMIRHGDCTYST